MGGQGQRKEPLFFSSLFCQRLFLLRRPVLMYVQSLLFDNKPDFYFVSCTLNGYWFVSYPVRRAAAIVGGDGPSSSWCWNQYAKASMVLLLLSATRWRQWVMVLFVEGLKTNDVLCGCGSRGGVCIKHDGAWKRIWSVQSCWKGMCSPRLSVSLKVKTDSPSSGSHLRLF